MIRPTTRSSTVTVVGLTRRHVLTLLCLMALLAAGCTYQRAADVAPIIPQVSESSRLYAADGSLLTVLHGEQNREVVAFEQLPRQLIDAVVAIEDRRFWEHNGVDLQAILRAAKANAESGGIAQGGSTITQQYVKNALLDPRQTVNRKLEEMSLAWQLERTSSKELILELYLNTIYFGHGAYGAEAAAQTYFGVPVERLDLAQAALLAGLIQLPSSTDPFEAPEAALKRRNLVLATMAEQGRIDVSAQLAAKNEPLHLRQEFTASDRFPAGHFVEEVKQFILSDARFGETEEIRRDLLFGGGLRIYTTVDLAMQAQGERAIAAVLPDPNVHPDAALVALEPSTGKVLAMVGGRDFSVPALTPRSTWHWAQGVRRGRPSSRSCWRQRWSAGAPCPRCTRLRRRCPSPCPTRLSPGWCATTAGPVGVQRTCWRPRCAPTTPCTPSSCWRSGHQRRWPPRPPWESTLSSTRCRRRCWARRT